MSERYECWIVEWNPWYSKWVISTAINFAFMSELDAERYLKDVWPRLDRRAYRVRKYVEVA